MLLIVALAGTIIDNMFKLNSTFGYDANTISSIINIFYGITGVVFAILGIFGIIGGAYAVKRKYWGLGLAAAIVSIFTFFPCGIAATILMAMSRQEFSKPVITPPPV